MDLEPAGKSAWEIAECSGRDTPRPADRAFVSAEEILEKLQRRLGRVHARQRIGRATNRYSRNKTRSAAHYTCKIRVAAKMRSPAVRIARWRGPLS